MKIGAVDVVGMSTEHVDLGKTRRRIEEALRKTATSEQILAVARSLNVQIATIWLPEVRAEEILAAELWEQQMEKFFSLPPEDRENLRKKRESFPKKFVLYHACRPSQRRCSPDLFTTEAARRFCRPRSGDEIARTNIDIIAMRAAIQTTDPKGLLGEDRETFRLLKQLLFPAK